MVSDQRIHNLVNHSVVYTNRIFHVHHINSVWIWIDFSVAPNIILNKNFKVDQPSFCLVIFRSKIAGWVVLELDIDPNIRFPVSKVVLFRISQKNDVDLDPMFNNATHILDFTNSFKHKNNLVKKAVYVLYFDNRVYSYHDSIFNYHPTVLGILKRKNLICNIVRSRICNILSLIRLC